MVQPCIGCSGRMSTPFSWGKLLRFSIFKQNLLLPIDQWFCESCRQIIVEVDEGCSMCSRSLHVLEPKYIRSWGKATICYDCERWKEWERSIEWKETSGEESLLLLNRSVLIYNEWAQELIERYKFKRDERLKYVLASFLLDKWTSSIQQNLAEKGIAIDLISVIPLSDARLMERGFNQSALVARLFAQELHIPYEEPLLLRAFEEGKQSKKDRNQRLQEIFKKFINNPRTSVDITNRSILLIDDIYTTGATMYAAAYTLKRLGAKNVVSLTIAR